MGSHGYHVALLFTAFKKGAETLKCRLQHFWALCLTWHCWVSWLEMRGTSWELSTFNYIVESQRCAFLASSLRQASASHGKEKHDVKGAAIGSLSFLYLFFSLLHSSSSSSSASCSPSWYFKFVIYFGTICSTRINIPDVDLYRCSITEGAYVILQLLSFLCFWVCVFLQCIHIHVKSRV